MWSTIRPAAARAARAGGTLPVSRLTSSRVAISRAAPSWPRRSSQARSFAVAAAAAPSGRPPAKKTAAAAAKKGKTTAAARGRKKAAATKKKAKPAAAKKRVRKVATPEEKRKVEVRELKKAALLKEPDRLPDNSWLVFISQNLKGSKMGTDGLAGTVSQLSVGFKALSVSELQRLQDTAERNKLSNNASYKAWVESHPPEVVADANRARGRLKRLSVSKRSLIQDDRQPKRVTSSYALFSKSRWGSGDFSGTPAPEAAKVIAREWKALSAHERQPYVDLGKADRERYEKEVHSVLGRNIRKASPSP